MKATGCASFSCQGETEAQRDRGRRGPPRPPAPRPALTTVHGDDRPVVLGEAGEARRVLGRRAVERRLVHLRLLHRGRDACVGSAGGCRARHGSSAPRTPASSPLFPPGARGRGAGGPLSRRSKLRLSAVRGAARGRGPGVPTQPLTFSPPREASLGTRQSPGEGRRASRGSAGPWRAERTPRPLSWGVSVPGPRRGGARPPGPARGLRELRGAEPAAQGLAHGRPLEPLANCHSPGPGEPSRLSLSPLSLDEREGEG